jgi:hypothetical protein
MVEGEEDKVFWLFTAQQQDAAWIEEGSSKSRASDNVRQ